MPKKSNGGFINVKLSSNHHTKNIAKVKNNLSKEKISPQNFCKLEEVKFDSHEKNVGNNNSMFRIDGYELIPDFSRNLKEKPQEFVKNLFYHIFIERNSEKEMSSISENTIIHNKVFSQKEKEGDLQSYPKTYETSTKMRSKKELFQNQYFPETFRETSTMLVFESKEEMVIENVQQTKLSEIPFPQIQSIPFQQPKQSDFPLFSDFHANISKTQNDIEIENEGVLEENKENQNNKLKIETEISEKKITVDKGMSLEKVKQKFQNGVLNISKIENFVNSIPQRAKDDIEKKTNELINNWSQDKLQVFRVYEFTTKESIKYKNNQIEYVYFAKRLVEKIYVATVGENLRQNLDEAQTCSRFSHFALYMFLVSREIPFALEFAFSLIHKVFAVLALQDESSLWENFELHRKELGFKDHQNSNESFEQYCQRLYKHSLFYFFFFIVDTSNIYFSTEELEMKKWLENERQNFAKDNNSPKPIEIRFIEKFSAEIEDLENSENFHEKIKSNGQSLFQIYLITINSILNWKVSPVSPVLYFSILLATMHLPENKKDMKKRMLQSYSSKFLPNLQNYLQNLKDPKVKRVYEEYVSKVKDLIERSKSLKFKTFSLIAGDIL